MLELSIILVNWNSADYLGKCLESVYAQTHDIDFEVIVVDNASFDGAGDLIARRFPGVKFLQSRENLGFAAANNMGFEQSCGKNILLLNPDTEVIGTAIQRMSMCLDALPDAGIVGCTLLNSDGSVQTSSLQAFPGIWNQLLSSDWLKQRWPRSGLWGIAPLYSRSAEPVRVDVVSGACLMIKRDVFESVGLLDTQYFMYSEDVALCYKVRQKGLWAYYLGNAQITHHGGKSSAQMSQDGWVAVAQKQARLQFFRATRGRAYAFLYRCTTGMAAVCRLLLLTAFFPFRSILRRRSPQLTSTAKWLAILKWSLGVER